MIDRLIIESVSGITLMESRALPTGELDAEQERTAGDYVRSHSDYTAYHLLFALRRKAIGAYSRLSPEVRARVLCSALGHLRYLNDWGTLDPHESHDGEAASALLETGKAAVECLVDLLDDRRPAPLFGSEEATMSSIYQYRRCDFAFRYVSLLRGRTPTFDPQPERRDVEVERLKGNLQGTEDHSQNASSDER
jgi:hypothetical protein